MKWNPGLDRHVCLWTVAKLGRKFPAGSNATAGDFRPELLPEVEIDYIVSATEETMEENIGESMMRKFVHKVFRKSDDIG